MHQCVPLWSGASGSAAAAVGPELLAIGRRFLRHASEAAVLAGLFFPRPAVAADFATQIQPLLETRCLECHRSDATKGGLRMERREQLLQGGAGGAAIVPGDPAKSRLIQRIHLPREHDEHMPPKGDPLGEAEKALLEQWISEGAAWPDGALLRFRSPEEQRQRARAEARQGQLRELRLFPETITLESARDAQTILLVATYQDDVTIDVTPFARFRLANPALGRFELARLLPQADGATELIAEFAGREVKAPVEVKGATQDRPASFRLDVMPVFMRGGCNTGGCHGSARGKDGFRLSLFGFDPEGDYHRLTREMNGRRINLNLPAESLVVEKALERVPHSGGRLFTTNSPLYATLVEWIRNGAPKDPDNLPRVQRIEVFPKELVLEGLGARQQLVVRAYYTDGTDRDVTHLVVFSTNNETSVRTDKSGLLSAGEPGEAFILARFDTFSVGTQAIVIPEHLEYTRPAPDARNYLDDLVAAKLHKLRLLPSGLCRDDEFLRRATLDLIGRLPTEAESLAFSGSREADKRTAVVDTLLQRKEFIELWVMKWAELLQIRSTVAGGNRNYKGALSYYNWLQGRMASDVPLNQIARELLSASGGTFANPAANFYELERDTLKLTENVAQVFTGMRIQCAQCHNHPFDRWTLDDYYGFAAFFSQVGRKPGADPRETVIFNAGAGETPHPVTKRPVPPKFLGGETARVEGADRREVVADWLAGPDNPFFSRHVANTIWAHFFGVGIIEPVDDVRISNPASNPQLLDALAAHLREYHYDLRRFVRDLCASATYQRSTDANASNARDRRSFSHALVRRLPAEVLLDAISQVTDTPNKFKGLPLGARAVQIADGNVSTYFLTTFGRATRETVCSCEVKMEPSLSQALHLLNGEATGERIRNGGLISRLQTEGKTEPQIIESLYLRCFSRRPTAEETDALQQKLAATPPDQRAAAFEDLFWACLNSKEFLFNH